MCIHTWVIWGVCMCAHACVYVCDLGVCPCVCVCTHVQQLSEEA